MKILKINTSEAFRYLGYGNSAPDNAILKITKEASEKICNAIDGKYTYKYFPIEAIGENGVNLTGTSLVLTGKSICEHLFGCSGLILFAATLSAEVDRVIRSYQVQSMTHAVVADALASAAVEQLFDMLETEVASRFEGKYLSFRFSPGYGDLPLELQPEILKVLSADKRIGVNITEGGLMAPVKSVTAIIGISDKPVANKSRGCITCNIKDKCTYRVKGEHCGV